MELKTLASAFHTPPAETLNEQISLLQADLLKNPQDQAVDEEMIAADQLIEQDGTNILNNPADLNQLNTLDSEIAKAYHDNPNDPIWSELQQLTQIESKA